MGLQFSDTTNKDGILQHIEYRCNLADTGITGDATLLKQITGQINNAYLKATEIMLTADGRWMWDDSNQTDLPIATADLVESQKDYNVIKALPSTNQDWLRVTRVEIKDASAGNWITLRPRDRSEHNWSVQERFEEDSTPIEFDFDGATLYLRPAPNYDSTAGLKVWFARAPLEFASTDTTKKPGFASLFHEYLVLYPVYLWEKAKRVGNPEQTMRDMKEMEAKMARHYSDRDEYEVNKIARPARSYK